GGDAHPAQHALADPGADLAPRAGQPGQVQEAFVDGIDFLGRGELADDAHHPVAHVAIQGEVGGNGNQAPGLQVADAEPGSAHGDAHGLGLGRARDGAAVVVGQHDDGLAFQRGPQNAFAGAIEAVAVDQRDAWRRPVGLSTHVTTPQMASSWPWRSTMSGKAGLAARRRTWPSRRCRVLTVNSPSTTATTMSPCRASMARSTIRRSPSSMPASRMDSPRTYMWKVASGCWISSVFRSIRF